MCRRPWRPCSCLRRRGRAAPRRPGRCVRQRPVDRVGQLRHGQQLRPGPRRFLAQVLDRYCSAVADNDNTHTKAAAEKARADYRNGLAALAETAEHDSFWRRRVRRASGGDAGRSGHAELTAIPTAPAVAGGVIKKNRRHNGYPNAFPSSRALREQVLARDGNTCRYCGRPSAHLSIDDVYPVARGGETTLDNLVAACDQCNSRKAAGVGRWPRPLDWHEREAELLACIVQLKMQQAGTAFRQPDPAVDLVFLKSAVPRPVPVRRRVRAAPGASNALVVHPRHASHRRQWRG